MGPALPGPVCPRPPSAWPRLPGPRLPGHPSCLSPASPTLSAGAPCGTIAACRRTPMLARWPSHPRRLASGTPDVLSDDGTTAAAPGSACCRRLPAGHGPSCAASSLLVAWSGDDERGGTTVVAEPSRRGGGDRVGRGNRRRVRRGAARTTGGRHHRDRLEVPWGIGFLPDGRPSSPSATRARPAASRRRHGRAVIGTDRRGRPRRARPACSAWPSPRLTPSDHRLPLRHHRRGQPDRPRCARRRPARRAEADPRPASPTGFIHDGGRLAFGPDGKLYVTTGETGDGQLAQDRDSLGRQDPADHARRRAGARQPRSGLAGLDARPPQRAGPRLRRRRPAVGLGVRARHLRRAQPDRAGRQLRLAGGRGPRRRRPASSTRRWCGRTDEASPSGLAYARRAALAGARCAGSACGGSTSRRRGGAPGRLLRRRVRPDAHRRVAPDGRLWVDHLQPRRPRRPGRRRTTGSCVIDLGAA